MLAFEEFSRESPSPAQPTPEQREAERTQPDPTALYDDAYKAGWDDALASVARKGDSLDAEFERNLQELSFSFHEARQQVSLSLQSLIEEILNVLVPRLTEFGLADRILEILVPLVEGCNTPSIGLYCAPADRERLAGLLSEQQALPIEIRPEDSMLSGQVGFRIGHERHEIDLSGVVGSISAILDEHFAAIAKDADQGASDAG